MHLLNYYYSIKSALPKNFCNEVIKFASKKKDSLGNIGNTELSEKNLEDLKIKRDSNIVFFSDEWIYKEVLPFIDQANKKAGWNFQIDRAEPMQFTKYKLNQFYGWHTDSWQKPYEKKDGDEFVGKIRKLSATIQLSDENDYEGGDLEFQFRNDDDPNIINNKNVYKTIGSIIVFPSFVWHRVKPVTKGVRYSLVMWFCGKPFQ